MPDETHVVFACDESGAKGYANQDEIFPGEVGVFAGILLPKKCAEAKMPPFRALITKHTPSSGKLHIADLPDEQKEELRSDVYKAISDSGLPCFWYAIHVAGFRDWHLRSQDQARQSNELTASSKSRVKRGSPRIPAASLHVELFSGLYGNLIAFLEERERKELNIEIRSDQIDSPIVREFDAVANRLLSADPHVARATGFDTITKSVVEGQVCIQISYPLEMQIGANVRSLSINPIKEGDGLVLAADVLANSLNHLFKNRSDAELYGPLNTSEAVIAHPLARHLDAFNDWGTGDAIGDGLYKHPKAAN